MLHLFNPGHEYALLNQSPYYTAPSNIVKMQEELAFIASWYANEGDMVLVYDDLSKDFKKSIKKIDLKVRTISLKKIAKFREDIKDQKVELWGITPQAIHLFEEINNTYRINISTPQWDNRFVDLGSRKKAQECLSFLIDKNSDIQSDVLPQIHTSLETIDEAVNSSPFKLLAKAPFSSSGRGLLWLPVDGLTRTENQILHGILKKQSYVVIEKALNRKMDFAMEFNIADNDVEFLGYSLFNTNEKGVYLGNYLGRQERILEKIGELIEIDILNKIKSDLIQFFKTHYCQIYNGYVGVDMMIYEENGQYFLQPCIEINMRNNMGILSLKLSDKFLLETSEGHLHIDFSSKGNTYSQHLEDTNAYPLKIEDGRVKSGYLPLCPVLQDSSYRAYIIATE